MSQSRFRRENDAGWRPVGNHKTQGVKEQTVLIVATTETPVCYVISARSVCGQRVTCSVDEALV